MSKLNFCRNHLII